ncbi:MAG TPA: hypothetical protein VFT22_18895 [Kofleriaceae bacterium]|nr:hypothetical protein [Kofleriaceae bacterium]
MSVPVMGNRQARVQQDTSTEAVTFVVQPRKITLIQNDHNHADEAHVTVDWRDAGTDPRLLRNAAGVLYLANADERGNWEPTEANARFAGILTRASRRVGRGEAMTVDLEFLDYTTLFLEAKPFGTKGVPDYSQRLDDAWKRVVSQTPGAGVLADRLVLQGLTDFPLLGKAVSKRFAGLAKVPVKNTRTDAWAVWQQCVGMLGLISYIRVDQCVVTTTQSYYTSQDPPRLIWGKNILAMTESRNPYFGKGVGLASFDPLTGRSVEAFWPPFGDARIRKKVVAAKRKVSAASVRQGEDREYFTWASATDVSALTEIAKRVYEERGKQEMEGTITTAEMFTDTLSGKSFDLLTLKSGDNVRIEFDQRDKELLQQLPTERERVEYLKKRGYSEDVATLMARNMSDFALLDPTFYVKRVVTSLEVDKEGGSYETEINYVNRILVSGDAAPATP